MNGCQIRLAEPNDQFHHSAEHGSADHLMIPGLLPGWPQSEPKSVLLCC
jgi:hypothetical protein